MYPTNRRQGIVSSEFALQLVTEESLVGSPASRRFAAMVTLFPTSLLPCMQQQTKTPPRLSRKLQEKKKKNVQASEGREREAEERMEKNEKERHEW
jgi:hypothetical protein